LKSEEFCCSLDCAVVSILSAAIHFKINLSPWSRPILQAINLKALCCGLVVKSGEFCCCLYCAFVSILSEAIHIEICLSLWSRPILQEINVKKLCDEVSL